MEIFRCKRLFFAGIDIEALIPATAVEALILSPRATAKEAVARGLVSNYSPGDLKSPGELAISILGSV